MGKFNLHEYDDIMDLPHYTSPNRRRMPSIDRAAQFAPFAALAGYDADVLEAARVTHQKLILTEDMKEILDRKQRMLAEIIDEQPEITVTYFVPDLRKAGGSYQTVTGNLKIIDEYEQMLVMTNGKSISIADVISIDSEVLEHGIE
ncbi:MAG: hypothetical protein J6D21_03260 [Clostridia bacterium]|nr:hypothetical protein [Clostridia bacterium]